MLSVSEAEACIISHSQESQITNCGKTRTVAGSFAVSAQNITADRDFPPYDRVAMDGIAINFESYQTGQRAFFIESMQAAGSLANKLSIQNNAIEVMTGAVLPKGTNTVIRYEDISIKSGIAKLSDSVTIKIWQNIHKKGSDSQSGTTLIHQDQVLLSPQWAIAASVGLTEVETRPIPRISIIGTGDELCELASQPMDHQIRASNLYAIAAALRDHGFSKIDLKIVRDELIALETQIKNALDHFDMCIITGAVSAGKFDLVPNVLKKLEVQEIFHKIAQRPGKPLWFGKSSTNKIVFGLPGNPVSSLICCYRYVIPAAYTIMGAPRPRRLYAQLTDTIDFNHGKKMTLFHPIKIIPSDDAKFLAAPLVGISSGDLASLCQSDGFVECQSGSETFAKGQIIPCYLWSRI